MKYSVLLSALLVALTLSACDKPAVVTPTVVTVPVPGPAGPTGATGEAGKTGGDTIVVVPAPAPEPASAR